MIEIKKISQSYGTKQILNNIDLKIQDGKITALIGANGAGKSTLLGVISRLLQPSNGEIFIDEKDISKMKSNDIAKELSILKQTNQINIKITVKELVTYGRFPYSKGRLKNEDIEKIESAITYMKLKEIENSFIDELSGGQRQRAYIAMILAQDTKYIFLDEPLNNLDMKYAVEMMTILQNLVKDFNKTIIVVMHDINFAAAFCDHIVAMKDGQIVKEGSSDEMMDKETLDHVFDHDFCIAGVNGKKVCIYYNQFKNQELDGTSSLENKKER
ncbi:iron chelate ABC transporter ATP-binding protein [Alteracholeplasma palmae J233]|uniref:Iron chelate ABC transporter ATP-binding protein n=1 Tax=Alteracholeplasma palmae (strain ATCC 49389 / J233) TaxID=1318466 RepID=U4KKB9_ALTPJ|nr:ATP-binding cassette domain-containing protein [Alteracholeplasma palmae]CCV64154.1 iron chelate ABC transporter ATP-binding protein [Alteracholeplasma palmae J233]